jgi:DNA repair protein RadD
MYQLDIFTQQPSTQKQLRNYQRKAIDSVLSAITNGVSSICLAMPTGAGKSHTISKLLIEVRANHHNCVALVPRRKLKQQLRHEFKDCGLSPQIAQTAQYITNKKLFEQGKFRNLKYIILDECHELAWWQPVEKLRCENPNAIVIGLTATPDRSSKHQFIEDKFDEIIYPISFGELVSQNYLCNPRYFSYGNNLDLNEVATDIEGSFVQEQLDRQCEKQHFNESIVANLLKHNVATRRSIVFCSSIKQSKKLTQMLSDSGISSIHVDGSMSESDQESAISKVASGEISALSCAKLLIAGFDEPRIDTVVLATATNSRQNLVQMCGRGSRIHPEKNNEFWVFDFGDNFARLKVGLKQQFPYKRKSDREDAKSAPMKACSNCGHLVCGFIMVCPECGEIFPKKDKPVIDLQDMDIVEVEADLQDLYHTKQIRKIIREGFSKFEPPFIELDVYLQRHKIKSIAHIVNPTSLIGSIFKHRTLQNYLELKWFSDYHAHRLSIGKLYKHEEAYLKKSNNKKVEIADWVKTLAKSPNAEFGDRYINSKVLKKYIGNGRWQDVLDVLDFDSKANMQLAYKRKWQELNTEISQHLSIGDGEIDPDSIAELLQNGNTPELKDLHSRIAVLEWAYKYVSLIY